MSNRQKRKQLCLQQEEKNQKEMPPSVQVRPESTTTIQYCAENVINAVRIRKKQMRENLDRNETN